MRHLLFVHVLVCVAYVSSVYVPSATWMETDQKFLANMTIPDMVLPGTHDTGTYSLVEQVGPGLEDWIVDLLEDLKRLGVSEPLKIIKDWAVSQIYSVYDQLIRGIRFLDIRVVWDESTGQLRTIHSLLGTQIEVMLGDVGRFLGESKGEVLVIQVGNFAGMNATTHQMMIKLIQDNFGEYLWSIKNGYGTYSEMVSKNKRVLLFYDDAGAIGTNPGLWPSQPYLISDWADKDNYPDMYPIEANSVTERSGNPDEVYKLQWVLTASSEAVIKGLLDGPVKSLHDISKICNNNLDSFLDNFKNYRINLLMTDFFEETDNVDQARKLNRQMCNDDPRYRFFSPTGNDCRNWKTAGLCTTNNTVASDSTKIQFGALGLFAHQPDYTACPKMSLGFLMPNIHSLCPLTCGDCLATMGEPGSSCNTNSSCYYGICKQGICLTDMPRGNGSPCGVNYQCESTVCTNNACVGGSFTSFWYPHSTLESKKYRI